MKLISFKVLSEFRNLKGVELRFKPQTNTYVLIGNNGAGKSSLLEAVSSIFHSLYSEEQPNFEFNFTLAYDFDGHKVSIANKPGKALKLSVDKVEVDRAGLESYLPQRIVCNYSGEEMRIRQLYYEPMLTQYVRRLKTAGGFNPIRMVFVDKDLWKIILYIIIAQRGRYESFDAFLTETIGIRSVDKIAIEIDGDTLGLWRENPVSFYMKQLKSRIREDGSIALADLNPNDDEALTMFNYLSSAQSLITRLDITFNGGINAQYLSEGEKKLMVVLFILEVISDERSLVLLDEPDSHIHVARKPQLVEMFKNAVNRENVLTSHSPSLTAKFDDDSIIMLDRTADGHAQVVNADKQRIVSELTKDQWSLQRQNIFLASNDDIILVEGWTDEAFLTKALSALQEDGLFAGQSYEYLPCGGSDGVVRLKDHFHPKAGQHMFCFFDNDAAGWKGINKVFGKTDEETAYKPTTFGKARKSGDIWVASFPCAKGKANNFNIEDYFPRRIFLHYVLSFRSLNDVIDKDKLKNKMATDCNENKRKKEDFKNFRAVFSLIEEIKTADAAGLDHI